jgi:hypothetical protein
MHTGLETHLELHVCQLLCHTGFWHAGYETHATHKITLKPNLAPWAEVAQFACLFAFLHTHHELDICQLLCHTGLGHTGYETQATQTQTEAKPWALC